jgi:hypothetical protein
MKLVESAGGSISSDGLAALALVTALINTLRAEDQRKVLSEAIGSLSTAPGTNRDEARRIVGAMLGQLGPTAAL